MFLLLGVVIISLPFISSTCSTMHFWSSSLYISSPIDEKEEREIISALLIFFLDRRKDDRPKRSFNPCRLSCCTLVVTFIRNFRLDNSFWSLVEVEELVSSTLELAVETVVELVLAVHMSSQTVLLLSSSTFSILCSSLSAVIVVSEQVFVLGVAVAVVVVFVPPSRNSCHWAKAS